MYCRMCGNKLGDTDHYCQFCGAPTGFTEASKAAEATEIKEEIVFNPPHENKSRFVEADPVEGEEASVLEPSKPEKDEDLREFISENEIEKANKGEDIRKQTGAPEAENSEKQESEKQGLVRNSEFTWNVYEFPKSRKKTDDVEFNWNLDEYGQPEKKQQVAESFEEELFREIGDEANRVKEQNIDRFFTFSKKNEEFQELLDKEYEKFRTRSDAPQAPAHIEPELQPELQPDAEVPEAAKYQEETLDTEVPVKIEPIEPKEVFQPVSQSEPAEIPEREKRSEQREPLETAIEEGPLAEMARARAQFFGEELVADNDSIRRKLASEAAEKEAAGTERAETVPVREIELPQKSETESIPKSEIEFAPESESGSAPEQETEIEPEKEQKTEADREMEPEKTELAELEKLEPADDAHVALSLESGLNAGDQKKEENVADKRRKIGVGQVAMIILAIILAAEIAILGVRYFAPDSAAAKAIGKTQIQVIKTVMGWFEKSSDQSGSSGDQDKNDQTKPGNGGQSDNQNGSQSDNTGSAIQGGTADGQQPADVAANVQTPDPNPTADKNALISSQMGNNKNIEQIKANAALAYQQGKNYGQSDINNSAPITNNIWQAPEGGTPVYYDQSVVGTVIAFDSQWIDYVNRGDKSVLELLKKDSEAYKNAMAYSSKTGKMKEAFKLLEIGDIRQGSKGFYVWVHEEIRITEKGTAANKKYNWIYYLEPAEGKMKIVNYFKF